MKGNKKYLIIGVICAIIVVTIAVALVLINKEEKQEIDYNTVKNEVVKEPENDSNKENPSSEMEFGEKAE